MVCHNTYQNENKEWVFPNDVEKKENNLIQISTGKKVIEGAIESMSKSKKNVIDPESIISVYGADSARWFMLSDSPPEKDINWSESGINGAWKICQKIWHIVESNQEHLKEGEQKKIENYTGKSLELIKVVHQNLNSITQSIERFQMNVAIAKVFEIVNKISKFEVSDKMEKQALIETLKILIRVIEPMVPHLAEECWTFINSTSSISNVPWPEVNESYLVDDKVVVVIQINGKRRGELLMPRDSTEDEVYKNIENIKNIKDALKQRNIIKSIYVTNKILNIVVS